MRKFFIVAAALVGVGLALFLLSRSGGQTDSPDSGHEQDSAAGQPSAKRAGTVPQPESPEDVGARGTADPGSTPALSQAPSLEDGVLEVVVAAGQRPVPGASVRLYWRGPRAPDLNEVSWRLASTGATDAQGRARLASRPGGYLVAVRAEGYAPLVRDVVRPYGEARTVVRLALEPGQSLTGRTVEQATQEPLPLVELVLTGHGRQLEALQRAEAPAEERVYGSSDERGNFRINGLAPGKYLLEARAPGHGRTVLRSVWVPSAGTLTVELRGASTIEGFVLDAQGNPAAGAEVQLGGSVPEVATTGSGGGFSVEVEAGAYTVSARRGTEAGSLSKPVIVSEGKTVRDVRIQLEQGSALEGRVVAQSTGAPVVGASVGVRPFGGNGDSGRTVTDGSGQFSVGGLAPGSYDLVVSAPGYSSITRRGLSVSSGERFPVELQLTGTGAVEGKVLDSAGQPVVGAQVVGGDRWAGSLIGAPAEARTDAEGHYRVEGLSAGNQILTARREGATLGTGKRVSITEGATAQVDFTLAEVGTVEGRVRGARGELPPDPLMVVAVPQSGGGAISTDFRPIAVDAAGIFRMTLQVGVYELRLSPAERWPFGDTESKTVEIEEGKTVQAEFFWQSKASEQHTLQGIVLEADGTPSPSAAVTVLPEEGGQGPRLNVSTDAQGRFTIPLSPEDVSGAPLLKLIGRNGGRTGELLGVRPGEQQLTLKLRSAVTVRGRVVRVGTGAPVKGFTLSAESQERGSLLFEHGTWEFPGDRFELRDIPSEPVRLTVRTVDGLGGMALVSPGSGLVDGVEIAVKGTAGVRGRVLLGATRQPLPGAILYLAEDRPMAPENAAGAAGADGRFTLEGVAPDARSLRAVSNAGFGHVSVTLTEGQITDVGDILVGPH